MKPRLRSLVLAHVFLVSFIALVMIPLVIVVSISLRRGNFAANGIFPTAETFSFEHWRRILGLAEGGEPVLLWFWNSVKVSAVAASGILLLSATAAYAFARMKFAGKSALLNSLLILQMFPMVLSLIAIYAILETLGRFWPALGLNSHGGLILAYLGGVAMHIWMIKGYFASMPVSIEESASVDGASPWQTFWMIMLPSAMPIFAVVFILSFIGMMGEYPLASVVLQDTRHWTLAVGANSFLYEQNYLWGDFAATAVLSGVPITVLFLFCQRFLVSGLTAGGVKE